MSIREYFVVVRNQMRVVIFIAFTTMLITSPVGAKCRDLGSDRLIVFQGFVLLAYFDDHYVEVKRLNPDGGHFYGYGWIAKDKVFVAYDLMEQGEAIADMEIIDLRRSKSIKLEKIGAVGEAHFDVNASRSQVIYSTGSDLKLITIDTEINEYRIYDILEHVSCWAEFWVDNDRVGCLTYDGKLEKMVFEKYQVPSLEDLKNSKDVVKIDLKWSEQER